MKSLNLCCVAFVLWGSVAAAQRIDFRRDVRPILADKCYACHGPDGNERKADLRFDTRAGAFAKLDDHFAIVAGKPEESALVQRIQAKDADVRMPPADHPKQLSAAEKRTLVQWIKEGAAWQDHWAYVVPQRSAIPLTRNKTWSRNLIDSFVLARLEKEQLTPASVAQPHTLIRRLSFDLTGLPPSAAEVKAFVANPSEEAYATLVNRLLESPHFGERMATYWLDLVRYADTVGYHGDQDVSVSPFRDYVIDAFNSNMAFDRFTREQLAGDLLPKPTRSQLVASGYNKLGMMSAEGGVQPKEYLAKYAADRVRTASSVWMGSTLGCAECHDHKFDPFTTKDFYRFEAFFADIKERGLYSGANRSGNWGPTVEVPARELPSLLSPIDQEIARLTEQLNKTTPELEKAQAAWETRIQQKSNWKVLKPTSATALHNVQLKTLPDGSLLASGPNAPQNTYTVEVECDLEHVTGFRVEVLPHKSLPRKGPGRAGNGNFVLTELRIKKTDVAQDGEAKELELRNPSATIEQTLAGEKTPYKKWSALSAVDKDAKGRNWGWAILPEAGKPHSLVVETPEIQLSKIRFTLEQNHDNGGHTIGRFRLSATSSAPPLSAAAGNRLPAEIQAIVDLASDRRNPQQQKQLGDWYRGNVAASLAPVRKSLEKAKAKRAEVTKRHTRTSLITVAVDPRPIRVLPRGNWMDNSGEIVQPGVPHFLRQINKPSRPNRGDLAQWITSRDNPLTARVFVNRLWKLYFGTGLSKVLDDVGSQGELPVHPELLDTLAVEFMDSGWNVKHMVRLIVESATYRQSSMMRNELKERDPYNRLLARQSRYRLDAEFVRDNALAVSGLLNRKVGGRSVKPYQPAGLYRHLNFPRRTYRHDRGDEQYRRGLYTHWQRQFLHPAMKAFDAPAREECTAERARSNTPLSALVLLNDPSYVEAARVLAEGILQSAKSSKTSVSSDKAGTDEMLLRAIARPPNAEESKILLQLLQTHRKYYAKHEEEAQKLIQVGEFKSLGNLDTVELAAWTSVARVIFNMHEFITRN